MTDPTGQAVKIAKLEIRMQGAEKAVSELTGDVRDQLKELNGKLGDLVTKNDCTTHSAQVAVDVQRAVQNGGTVQKSLLEKLREKAAAITVIGALIFAAVAGAYKVAKFAASVEDLVKEQTATVVRETKEVKHAVRKEPVKIYVPYEPDETTSPPSHPGMTDRLHRRRAGSRRRSNSAP